MRFLFVFLSLFFVISSCEKLQPQDKFQMVAGSDGFVYRLDKHSGEVWRIHGKLMQEVQGLAYRLKIGQRYHGEDGYSFLYLGKGKTGQIKTLGDYWIPKK